MLVLQQWRMLQKSYMGDPYSFDSIPVILKKWHENMNLVKDHVERTGFNLGKITGI